MTRTESLKRRLRVLVCGAGAIVATVALLSQQPANAESCSNARTGPSANLPDCRAYEQVSPIQKGGYDAISGLSLAQYPAQAASSGEAVSYMGAGPFAGALGSGLPDARVSTRAPSGWQTTDVTPPTSQATPAGGWVLGYDFSEDLSQMVVKVPQQELASGLTAGMDSLYNLFLRRPNGSYTLVNSAPPLTFPPPSCMESCLEFTDVPAFAGASSDFTHVLFESNGSLQGTGAPEGAVGNLYEQSGGSLRLVGVLPDGKIAQAGATAGAGGKVAGGANYSSVTTRAWRDVNHAISLDGRRVLFEAAADGGAPDPGQKELTELYDRIEGGSTVEISAPAAGASPANGTPEPAQFWAASSDGSDVFFTSSAELTSQSNTGANNNSQDLYRYDLGDRSLIDLTVDTADATTGAGVLGVLGASSDGSYVYFVATGQLLAGQGEDGKPNLYVSHEDPSTHERTLSFIATLAPAGVKPEQEPGDSRVWTSTPAEQQAYVTPDGRHVAFMSLNELTGYDNLDQLSNKSDYEVYVYEAGSARPICASCDPSGARPLGSAFIGASLNHLASSPFHQPRVLSDDGSRLFFSSPDRLAGGAVDSHAKVYEYERSGVGSCESAGGCLYLLSDTASPTDDVFLDASASGGDVFLATLSQLTASDHDELIDVYDVRAGGGFPEPLAPNPCPNNCQGTPSPPSAPPQIVSDLVGASGNLAARASKPKPKPSCRQKAARIRNARARSRALKRCPTARSRGAGRARGHSKRSAHR